MWFKKPILNFFFLQKKIRPIDFPLNMTLFFVLLED